MLTLLALLLGAANAEPERDPELDGQHPEAIEVFSCKFAAENDINHDGWPDHWKRQRDSRNPAYVNAEIVQSQTPSDQRCLQVDMNGGGAVIHSPPIPISPLFSYVLESRVRTRHLKFDDAAIRVELLDERGRVVRAHQSEPLSGDHDWVKVRIGPLSIEPRVRRARISLHLAPRGKRADLYGSASFDYLWFGRLPQMQLDTGQPFQIFERIGDAEVRCEVSGITDPDPEIQFELFDHRGLFEAIEEAVITGGKPFMGICIGMQMLASRGLEYEETPGFDWIGGQVEKIAPSDASLKVPHMGWNNISLKKQAPIFNGVKDGSFVYFVHSYYCAAENSEDVAATCSYGDVEFCAA